MKASNMTKISKDKGTSWFTKIYSLNTPTGGFVFIVPCPDGPALTLNTTELKNRAEMAGIQVFRSKDNPTAPSEFEVGVLEVQNKRRVDVILPALAGYRAGPHRMGGGVAYVLSSPSLIQPSGPKQDPKVAEMDADFYGWPTLFEVFSGRLVGVEADGDNAETFDQLRPLLVWIWHNVQSLYGEQPSTGLVLGLFGDPGTGKSLLIWILSQIFGGRVSRPFRYLAGLDGVNDDVIGSELGVLDDENYDSSPKAVEAIDHGIKQFVSVGSVRLRKHYSCPMEVSLSVRLILAANLEPDCLAALPKVRSDTEDKFLYLKIYDNPFPCPCETLEERKAFQDKLRSEFPAFINWLLNVFQPDRSELGRFGAKAWQHPAVVEELGAFDPCERTRRHLEALIRGGSTIGRLDLTRVSASDADVLEKAMTSGPIPGICGSVAEIRSALLDDDGPLSQFEKREVRAPAYFGRDLSSLQNRLPKGVLWQTKSRTNGTRRWILLGESL